MEFFFVIIVIFFVFELVLSLYETASCKETFVTQVWPCVSKAYAKLFWLSIWTPT